MNAPIHIEFTSLDDLGVGVKARITDIDWATLGDVEGRRLRNFGFDQGVVVELLHFGPFGRDPIAIRVGRMTVAIRRKHAAAVRAQPIR